MIHKVSESQRSQDCSLSSSNQRLELRYANMFGCSCVVNDLLTLSGCANLGQADMQSIPQKAAINENKHETTAQS